jgi:RES domain-containing protein
VKTIKRGGHYYRVCDPTWQDPLDTSYAKRRGGRWNPPGVFGALYLNATIEVAAANARRNFAGEIATLFDLQVNQRPDLVVVAVSESPFLDIITPEGLRLLRLPASYPIAVSHKRCQGIAKRAYCAKNLDGVACRSNAEATSTSLIGEELAVFDRSAGAVRQERRVPFAQWYPTEFEQPTL